MTTTFESAKVGDKVWHLEHGWGDITVISPHEEYPIVVTFDYDIDISDCYTYSGKANKYSLARTLFWDEIEIIAPSKPLPDLPVDTKVYVWMDGGVTVTRHLSHLVEQGKAVCYDDGQTSWTSRGRHSVWDNWELAE